MSDREERAQEYHLGKKDAEWLAGAAVLPTDVRKEIFAKYAEQNGVDALANLLAQFVGLANSVVANQKDALVIFQIVECDTWPDTAEKLNLPTIFGACNGVIISSGIDQDDLCHGCAFRTGSLANQSPSTTADADWCSHPGEDTFWCHEHLEDEKPTKACAGFARLRANRKRAA